MLRKELIAVLILGAVFCGRALGQVYGSRDTGSPGDEMIQAYLAREADRLDAAFLENVKTREDWEALRPRYKEEYFHMLGLWPMPEKTPLQATVTGTFEGDGFVVEKLHYQSRPRLYVTANLYRPPKIEPGKRLPAVVYVCGHSNEGRNGNKTAYQAHGIWFARHGYICLTLDSLQLGEIGAIHHGTYREGRWWWHSRGYTPAGVECLNGMRGIDYLQGRPDVDPERIAVTGISGGGAATFWIASADERAAPAVPVSGMADLSSYVGNLVINGHCDCMFLYNTFRWPWTRIAALVAPRPMLFTNSDADAIFPMDANDRIICRLERMYSLYGASDHVDAMVSIGGHAYREDLRRAIYRFINIHLKNDPSMVEDSEVDLVSGRGAERRYPIPPERLRVFPEDSDLPKDELNTTIDEHFVPMAEPAAPKTGEYEAWREGLVKELRRVTFGYFPERVPAAKPAGEDAEAAPSRLATEEGIVVALRALPVVTLEAGAKAPRVVLNVLLDEEEKAGWNAARPLMNPDCAVYELAPRGVGPTRWTTKNPPNYVERSHVLLGRTVAAGRVWDIIATARYLREKHGDVPLWVTGDGAAGLLAAYAVLLEPEIAGAAVHEPPLGHMDPAAPALLNVLRVCDVPETLGMIAPRPLVVRGVPAEKLGKAAAIYEAAGAKEKFEVAQ